MTKLLSVFRTCAMCVMATIFCAAQAPPAASATEFFNDQALTVFRSQIGNSAEQFGVTKDKMADFLSKRAQRLDTARLPEWSVWFESMDKSTSLELRAWALARRLEAGDLTQYLEYEKIIFEHVLAISKTGHSKNMLKTALTFYNSFLSPFYIDSNSTFWQSFEKTIRKNSNLNLHEGLYAIWCFNTHPKQRELIFDLSKNVLIKDGKKKYTTTWHDPRFWIILDWLYSWGEEDDFASVLELLPKKAKSTFSRLFKEAKELPCFFNSRLNLPNQTIADSMPDFLDLIERADTDEGGNKIIDVLGSPSIKKSPQPPGYPQEARSRRLMTELALEITIDKTGKPIGCRPRPGPWRAFFAPTGVKYAMGLEFEPAKINGEPIVSKFLIIMPFRMEGPRLIFL